MRRLKKIISLPYLPVWITALVLLSPIFLTGKALFWGTPLLQFGPWWNQAWSSIRAGYLPLWNPLLGMGAPLIANYQSALFYPINWIYFMLNSLGGARLMAWGMAPIAALHLAWAGLGMVFLTRRLGLGVLAQAVSGLAFGLSGYLVTRLGFLSINAACAWIPWMLVWLTPDNKVFSSENPIYPRRQDFLKLIFSSTALLLAGHAQIGWYAFILAAAWTAFWAWELSKKDNPGHLLKSSWSVIRGWGFLGFSTLFATAIAAIQLVPTAEYLQQSQRAAMVEYDFAVNYSLWPWHLLTLAAPGFFGSPVSGDYWGYGNFWEDALYIGLLPLLLGVSAVLKSLYMNSTSQTKRRLIWFLIGMVFVSLILAFGKNTPIFPWLYNHIPSFNMFQAPARWLIWTEFSLALLAGLGAEKWRRPMGWGLYWTRLATMGAIAVTIGSAAAWIILGSISPSFIRATAMLGFLGAICGILSLLAPLQDITPRMMQAEMERGLQKKKGSKSFIIQLAPPSIDSYKSQKQIPFLWWSWGVVAFIAMDLLFAWWGINPGETTELYSPSATSSAIRKLSDGGRIYVRDWDEDWLKYSRFLRFSSFYPGEAWQNLRAVELPNTNLLDRLASVNNFDPLVPARYAEWLKMIQVSRPEVQAELIDLMDIGLIISRSRREPYGVSFTPHQGTYLRRVPCKRAVGSSDQAQKLMLEGNVDFDREVIIEDPTEDSEYECSSGQNPEGNSPSVLSQIRADLNSPGHVEYQAGVNASGWLVIADTWYPGWKAWVDGQSTPIFHANYLFRAIFLPAGDHHIVFEYKPVSFTAGALISLVSLTVIALIALSGNKSRLARNGRNTSTIEDNHD